MSHVIFVVFELLRKAGVIVKHEVIAVDNPVRLTVDTIKERFWDNYVLVSNLETGSNAGVVRYYCYANEPALTERIMEMDRDEATYGDCLIYYVGPGRGFLGVYV
jgi:hypothetical protein